MNSTASLLIFSPHHSPALTCVLHYMSASLLGRSLPFPRSVYPSVSLLHSIGSAGIYTCCPSPTTSVLGLGPDLPWADEPSPGNLGLSTGMFLACLSLLIPAFSLVQCPPCLSIRLLPLHIAPLPRILRCTHRFGVTFSPGHLRRTITRPVSYYALFKCVAASEPTSWLSVQFHILLHLT